MPGHKLSRWRGSQWADVWEVALSSGLALRRDARVSDRGSRYPRRGLAAVIAAVAMVAACNAPTDHSQAPPATEAAVAHPGGPATYYEGPSDSETKITPRRPEIFSGSGSVVGNTSSVQGAESGDTGDITLSFVDADVHEVVRSVLGDVLHLNYSIDPKIQATITVQTSRPLRRDAVLPVLQEVLHASGLALVRADGLYRVVPIEDAARSGAASVVVGSQHVLVTGSTPSFHIRVLPLRFASATELAQTLQPFVPKGTVIEADASRNLLIVTGVEADLASVVDLVNTFDVDWLAGMSYGIFPLESATPKSVVSDLNEIFGGRGGNSLGGVVRFVPLERISAVLVISPQRQYVIKVGQWIRRLDTNADETTARIFEYRVQNSRAVDLAKVLSALFQGQVQTVGATAPGSAATTLGENYGGSQPGTGGGLPTMGGGAGFGTTTPGSLGGSVPAAPGTATFGNAGLPQSSAPPAGTQPSPSGGQAASPEQTAEAALPGASAAPGTEGGENGLPRVRIIADEKNNALVIYATPKVYRMIEDTLRKLDIVPLQVLIEATIAEVTLNDNLQYGVQWFFKNNSSSISLSNVSTGAVSAIFPGFNYVLTGGAGPQLVLSALSAVTNVKVISSPQLLVLDNHVASLQVGDEVPIPTAQITQTVSNGAPLVNTIQYLPTGVILHVAPRVNTNGVISLDIAQEVSTVTNTTSSSLNGPTIQQRRLLSSVSVRDGETIALGGLIQDSVTLGNSGLPILSNLPLFGDLFGTKSNQRVRTELLILLSPHVLHNASEARQVTDELRQQMRLVTPLVVTPAPR